ncbi:asparagine synthetase B [Actinoplanes sp. NBRC 14428]|uniref:asparagine synthase (glutamine-hydrolyzing) n=1 Tax=Pseudosporangium ferrugineum TaxID=439699 RepID=A0A2T0SFB9_9ACTN|nr:asparagine synthase (glutamine-hydrolyzing) [Pseudosporangium ferrugineum]PRY32043.1 asparagine synthase (glutamine-hydrolysing) [Pseudosporangium ferrugineum]BCJ49718.1 asparagine synthetase B [Actinoplanes sp. NBRC 14428]
MCGLVGRCTHAGGTVTADEIREALAPIRHRGPDADGVWTGAGIGLGHVRLSILDLSDAAAQPMVSPDGRYVLAFNGEIYNFRQLRDELREAGVQVHSTGDTEVLLSLIAVHGCAAAFRRLEGDWAVAVWDTRDEVLTLGRDVHGVKPLYFRRTADGGLRFGSEIKALVATGGAAAEPSVAGINAALLGYSMTWGDRTLYRGVHAVRPGERLVFDPRRGTVDRSLFARIVDWVDDDLYRELSAAPAAEVVRRVDEAIGAGVRSRLVSDAPLACLASGGVDSSLIATVAGGERPDLPLYHADVVNDSERPAAEALAAALGLRLRTVRVTDADIIAAIPDVTWYNDGPLIYHLNALPFYAVCRLAAEDGIKVLLTGEGSDEYLIGYPDQALRPVLDLVGRVKKVPRSWLSALSPKAAKLFWPHPDDTFAQRLVELSSGFEAQTVGLASGGAVGEAGRRRDRRSRVASLDLAQSHLVSLLHRNDRLGMAWGLEARFPFLAPEFTRLAVNLPDRYKLRRTVRANDRRHPFIVDKWAIREVAARRLPKSLAARPKRGFPVSITRRLTVSPKFFEDGFVADMYGLNDAAIAVAVGDGPSEWLTRLILTEVWGQLFFRGAGREQMGEALQIHTTT